MNIYVTGIGAITGIGFNVEKNIEALRQGKYGMGKVTLFRTQLDVPVSEVKYSNKQLKECLNLSSDKSYSRTTLLGMLAAKEALVDAAIDTKAQRTGLISSTSVGGMDRSEHFYEAFKKDATKGRLRDIVTHDCGDSTEQIAHLLGVTDFVTTMSTACSSAANAIMLGARMIKNGLLDVAIVGGTDALCKFTLNGFNSLMILDSEHCRPMDRTRAGLNLGEGAGYLVLQADKPKNKKAYCTLSGYANANDAFHQTGSSPEGEGAYRAMSQALKMANLKPKEIDYLCLHGTATPNNDLSESIAIQRLFEQNIPPLSSVKSMIGHTLAASGGIEAVYSAIACSKGMLFPNLNFREAIEETGIIPITNWTENAQVNHVLSNSFGFGGNVSSLVFTSLSPLP